MKSTAHLTALGAVVIEDPAGDASPDRCTIYVSRARLEKQGSETVACLIVVDDDGTEARAYLRVEHWQPKDKINAILTVPRRGKDRTEVIGLTERNFSAIDGMGIRESMPVIEARKLGVIAKESARQAALRVSAEMAERRAK